jgi:hypothetical protein
MTESIPATRVSRTDVLRRAPQVVFHKLGRGRGGVLLQVETGAYYGVDAVGALLWQLLQGAPTVAELLKAMQGGLADVPAGFDVEIDRFLSDLGDRGLVARSRPDEVGQLCR